ncbi:UNVERIFIED_CONTAM: hypothetical protein GTU68_014998 [Idotea baltica]|nr:hypothetical protein [Idotea baltica]
MQFNDLFPKRKPLIACIHLGALPGAPLYAGSMEAVIDRAIYEAEVFSRQGVDGLIIENFSDIPFYPGRVPTETVAAMAVVAREVVNRVNIPVGINVLRNDADAALSIATAVGAHFIRINIHNAAALTDQGMVHGRAYETLRKRRTLGSQVLILADVDVKHAAPIAAIGLDVETRDLTKRSLADALIVSGSGTGASTDLNDLSIVQANTNLPVLIGSGTNPTSLKEMSGMAGGFIVGSYFKHDGLASNEVDPARVKSFVEIYNSTY